MRGLPYFLGGVCGRNCDIISGEWPRREGGGLLRSKDAAPRQRLGAAPRKRPGAAPRQRLGGRPAESCPYSWMPMTMAKTPVAYVAEWFIEMPFGHLLH